LGDILASIASGAILDPFLTIFAKDISPVSADILEIAINSFGVGFSASF
jgi:hypothetical protein